MVDISSQNNKINVTVSSSGNTANTNVTSDSAMYYSNKSKEWAISNRIVDNTDYSSKYYANESKKQADISTAKATEVVESGNTAVSNIESARNNAIIDVNTAGATQISNVNKAGATQVANVNSAGTTQVNLAKEQVTLATNQATIATNKTSEVVASGNTALANITTAKNNAITTITTQETTSKNNVITTGNEQVKRVNLTGVDNRTPIFTKSEVGTNESIYQNIYGLKHSTFDKSKFTVVGSPTITDDGVASGFKKGNDLKFPAITVTDNSTIVIRTKIKTVPRASSSDTQGQCIFGFYKNDTSEYIDTYNLWNGANITLGYKHKGVDKAQGISVPTVPNTEYDYKVEITKNAIKCYLDGELKGQQLNLSFDMSLINDVIGSIGTGARKGLTPTRMKIYLPDFSITVDGKEVFSGNKTGIDTIKADNYEVVGSPVISDDGVASGFSNSNYFDITGLSLNFNDGFTVITESTFGNGSSDMLWGFGYAGNRIRLQVYNNRCEAYYQYKNSSLVVITSGNFSTIKTGDKVKIEATFTTAKQVIKVYVNGVQVANGINSQPLTNFNFTSMFLGTAQDATSFFCHGSIDLNAFKIYVDGNLVYQPCLKIPYTQSKTGSKIVDVAYRDRVIDLYKQEGQAGYYTIDEENQNFTLPMGEIYGMIEGKAGRIGEQLANKQDVLEYKMVDSYVNGTSGYNVWKTPLGYYCEQWGEVSTTSARQSWGNITLTKIYKDINYNVFINPKSPVRNNTQLVFMGMGTARIISSNNFYAGAYGVTDVDVNTGFWWKTCGYLAEGEY